MLNPQIASALSVSTGSGEKNTLNAFKTLQNFVDARTEGVKLKNFEGTTDRTTIVAQSLNDMGQNPESRWAYDLIRTTISKPAVKLELIGCARNGKISATVLAHLVGKDRADRKAILAKCNSGGKGGKADGKPAKSSTTGQRSFVSSSPKITVVTTNIYDERSAAMHIASLSGMAVGIANGNRQLSFEPVGAGN